MTPKNKTIQYRKILTPRLLDAALSEAPTPATVNDPTPLVFDLTEAQKEARFRMAADLIQSILEVQVVREETRFRVVCSLAEKDLIIRELGKTTAIRYSLHRETGIIRELYRENLPLSAIIWDTPPVKV